MCYYRKGSAMISGENFSRFARTVARPRPFRAGVLAASVVLLALPAAGAGAAAPAGGVFAFGYNHYGQLGSTINNATSNPNPTPTLVDLPGESGTVTQVAAGGDHSLAVTSSGQLYAFGYNYYGQLGSTTNDLTGTPNPTPTLVGLPGESGTVIQAAAGSSDSFAVTSSGQLYAFGENYYGELGSATNNGTATPNPTPTQVPLPGESGTVTQVAAGGDHSLAVTSSGQLYAFGYNYYGQLGSTTDNLTETPIPTPTLVTLPGESGPVTQAAAGQSHSLVVTSSGQLYAFGYDAYGQLGSHNNVPGQANPTPTLVGLPGEIGIVTQVAAGRYHSLALTSSGQLYAFGYNQNGQLGSATNNGTATQTPTPTQVGLPGESGAVTQIAAGGDHSLAVTSSGQLYAFGENANGELGLAANSGTTTPNPTPTLVPLAPGTTVDTVAQGSAASHTLAIVTFAVAPTAPPAPALPLPLLTAAGPTISAVTQSASRWLESNRRANISKVASKPPVGTTFSFTLSETATVTFAFTDSLSGRKVGKRCVAQTKHNAKQRRCLRTVTAATLTFTGHAGTNKVKFAGQVSKGQKLKPGSYTLVISATASRRTSTTHTLKFTIAHPSKPQSGGHKR
jgi:alpha-tubulin suppressor-like RCC1 family protein